MTSENPNDPHILALQALAVTLGEQKRADRLLATTGLDPDDLRHRASAPEVLSATLAFLEAHEPDLVDVAGELGVKPEQLVAAHAALER
ncbi:DUF3572 domain-containing protein [Sphingomicrobium sediminis]|uniref:DUF3572 domain-containing protein n=1 Tax=Sphingomicrobium sediminis TaxID=2950949 RepID=A0A9X2EJW0_9SPHN|nr:DUF3572 domain-containing protein [Sphingomicrobium sediminis]MCM8558166.1 DUF3572 domain-containing protein [Sphingomicrobium sediminis]